MILDEQLVGEAVDPAFVFVAAGRVRCISEGRDSRLDREEMEKLFLPIA